VAFTTAKEIGNLSLVHVWYVRFNQEVGVGNRIYLDNGKLSGVMKNICGQCVEVEMLIWGSLSDHKGLNLPDVQNSAQPDNVKR
jgi:pyruvate kinase